MGAVAVEVHKGLGNNAVLGVVPREMLSWGVDTSIGQVKIVETMHERKALMADSGDAFVILPGGLGTLEEALEVLTWRQLNFIHKPIGILNVGGFYDGLLDFFKFQCDKGFVSPRHVDMVIVQKDPSQLVKLLLEQLDSQP